MTFPRVLTPRGIVAIVVAFAILGGGCFFLGAWVALEVRSTGGIRQLPVRQAHDKDDDAPAAVEVAAAPPREGGRHACELVRVTDGDTIVVDLHVGRDVWQHGVRVRLAGIDAPELPTPAGKAARAALTAKLAGQAIEIEETGADKYGRFLGRVLIVDRAGGDPLDVNAWLLDQGHAKPYGGGLR